MKPQRFGKPVFIRLLYSNCKIIFVWEVIVNYQPINKYEALDLFVFSKGLTNNCFGIGLKLIFGIKGVNVTSNLF